MWLIIYIEYNQLYIYILITHSISKFTAKQQNFKIMGYWHKNRHITEWKKWVINNVNNPIYIRKLFFTLKEKSHDINIVWVTANADKGKIKYRSLRPGGWDSAPRVAWWPRYKRCPGSGLHEKRAAPVYSKLPVPLRQRGKTQFPKQETCRIFQLGAQKAKPCDKFKNKTWKSKLSQ